MSSCAVIDCGRPTSRRNLCTAHYQGWRRGSDLGPLDGTERLVDVHPADAPLVCTCRVPRPSLRFTSECSTCHRLIVTLAHPSVLGRMADAFPAEWAKAEAVGIER